METRELYLRQNVDDVAVIALLQDRILDAVIIEKIGSGLKAVMDGDPRDKVVLDFGAVTYMSSAALGMLISFQKAIASKGGRLKLAGVRPAIMEVFRITNLDKVFDIHSGEQTALQAFARRV